MARLAEKLAQQAKRRAPTTPNEDNDQQQEQPSVVPKLGIHGVNLKRFEQVVARLLESVEPVYVRLPPPPPFRKATNGETNPEDATREWLFGGLPPGARVVGTHPHPGRARKKEGQLASMLRGILPLVPIRKTNPPANHQSRPVTLVDFGGGSGHLGIPLALLLPTCRIIVVDFNGRSIDLLHEKARALIRETASEADPERRKGYQKFASNLSDTHDSDLELRCCGESGNSGSGILKNLFTFSGPVEKFVGTPFDVAIALHLCGEATDVCLRRALQHTASAVVLAPCCVGKLSGDAFNPDVYHATGRNEATVTYPQSARIAGLLGRGTRPGYLVQADWNALAKAADYSNETEFRTSRNASRRTAKALLETDRQLFLSDRGYSTALMKMDPLEVTPKNDVLVAWRPEAYERNHAKELEKLFGMPDTDCQADLEVTKSHLLAASRGESSSTSHAATQPAKPLTTDRNDWTHQEEAEIRATIEAFFSEEHPSSHKDENQTKEKVLVFPTRMGGRKRKLIHYVAGQMNLAHWGQGKKVSEKTVAVARKRPPRGG